MMYAALHGIHALFVLRGIDFSDSHYGQYNTLLQKINQQELASQFLALVKASQTARYKCPSETQLEKLHRLARTNFDQLMSGLFRLGVDCRPE